jgi:alpha-ribazole phosphatase
MPTKLILIRHGETDWNAESRYLGHSDIGLNSKGLKQAGLLAKRLNKEIIHKVYASDSKRALSFAKKVFSGLCIEKMAQLKEINFGILEGETYDEVLRQNPRIYNKWLNEPFNAPAPGCETLNDFRARVRKIFRKLLLLNKNKTFAIVTHAGPIRVIINDILKVKNFWQTMPDLASLSIIEIKSNRPRVILFNDTTHLKNG